MIQVNLSEAKSHLSKFARMVKQGETIILCERNVPIAEIRPVVSPRRKRKFGLSRGMIGIDEDFFRADREIEEISNGGDVFPKS